MAKSTSLRSRGRSRRWFQKLAASATGTAPHQTGLCPAQPRCSPILCIAWGASLWGGGGAVQLLGEPGGTAELKNWEQSGMGREGAHVAVSLHGEVGVCVASSCSLPPKAGCMPAADGFPQPVHVLGAGCSPHGSVLPPLRILLWIHITALTAVMCGPGDSPASPMLKRWLCWAKGCSVLCHPLPHHQHQVASPSLAAW